MTRDLVDSSPSLASAEWPRLETSSNGFLEVIGSIALMAFIVILVSRVTELFPIVAPLRLGLISGGIAALAWVATPTSFHEKIPASIKPVKYFLFIFSLALLSVPLSFWPSHSFEFFTDIYCKVFLLFFLVLYWGKSAVNVQRILWMCGYGICFLIMTGALSGQKSEVRWTGDIDPNDIAR